MSARCFVVLFALGTCLTHTTAALSDVDTHARQLRQYLVRHSRVRAQIALEVDLTQAGERIWIYYDQWPNAWKSRLGEFFGLYRNRKALPISPLPLLDADLSGDTSQLVYRHVNVARDVYFAQVAHALWLDHERRVPWRLEDWSDHELSYLLSSKVHFSAVRLSTDNRLAYAVYVGAMSEATENILSDPRMAFRFMLREPEQRRRLLGRTCAETGGLLSGWIHDYLWHQPGDLDIHSFHRAHPLLADRLRRYPLNGSERQYVTSRGCWSASSLFADLMRSVNIPIRKVRNEIMSVHGKYQLHSGIAFDWQGGQETARYLLHTDDLFTASFFKDPAPAPKGTGRGAALWDHVWLDPNRFGEAFEYSDEPDVFARATRKAKERYERRGDWLVSSAEAIGSTRNQKPDRIIAALEAQGFTAAEASRCWRAVRDSVLAYGDGDMQRGFERLLDGPNSRHSRWCRRTGKCPASR